MLLRNQTDSRVQLIKIDDKRGGSAEAGDDGRVQLNPEQQQNKLRSRGGRQRKDGSTEKRGSRRINDNSSDESLRDYLMHQNQSKQAGTAEG